MKEKEKKKKKNNKVGGKIESANKFASLEPAHSGPGTNQSAPKLIFYDLKKKILAQLKDNTLKNNSVKFLILNDFKLILFLMKNIIQ